MEEFLKWLAKNNGTLRTVTDKDTGNVHMTLITEPKDKVRSVDWIASGLELRYGRHELLTLCTEKMVRQIDPESLLQLSRP